MKKRIILPLILITGLMQGAEKPNQICGMSVPRFCATAGGFCGVGLCIDAELVKHCCPKPSLGKGPVGFDSMLNRALYAAEYPEYQYLAEKAPLVGLLCCALPFAFWLGAEGCDQITDCCRDCCKDDHQKNS